MKRKILVTEEDLNTKSRILLAAKQEFFEKGFHGTSMRSIAERAGLTTGAIYNLFENKDFIFKTLIGNTFDELLAFLVHDSELEEKQYNMKTSDLSFITEISRRKFIKIVDFFYSNWDAMKLLVCCSKGSSYEHIFDKAIRFVEEKTVEWLKRDNIKVSKQTKFFIHVMVSTYMEHLKEIFHHDLKKAQALSYAIDINGYHCAGWKQYWMSQKEY